MHPRKSQDDGGGHQLCERSAIRKLNVFGKARARIYLCKLGDMMDARSFDGSAREPFVVLFLYNLLTVAPEKFRIASRNRRSCEVRDGNAGRFQLWRFTGQININNTVVTNEFVR